MIKISDSTVHSVDFRELCLAAGQKAGSEGLLPTSIFDKVSGRKKIAVGELAGRDSVAAMIKAFREEGFDAVIPVIAHTGTEFGGSNFVSKNLGWIKGVLGDVLTDTIVLHDFDFWHALNGRFVSKLVEIFGFYSPCPGCHLYLHALRIPLALVSGATQIISGERESHGGSRKINQLPVSLDHYVLLTSNWGVELNLPLRDVSDDDFVDELIGGPGLCIQADQFSCVFSGNYRDGEGNVLVDEGAVGEYYRILGLPATKRMLECLMAGSQEDLVGLVKPSFK